MKKQVFSHHKNEIRAAGFVKGVSIEGINDHEREAMIIELQHVKKSRTLERIFRAASSDMTNEMLFDFIVKNYSDLQSEVFWDKKNETFCLNFGIGFCAGLTSDRKLSKAEFAQVKMLFSSRDVFADNPLFEPIYKAIQNPLDGNEERMIQIFESVVGDSALDTGVSSKEQKLDLPYTDDLSLINLNKTAICLTGTFSSRRLSHLGKNSRKKLGEWISSHGELHDKYRKSTGLLVVGGKVSPDWKTAQAGRKIIAAMEDGVPICSEETFLDWLEKKYDFSPSLL